MRFPAIADRAVAASLRALPGLSLGLTSQGEAGAREMFSRAELHGVAGVIWDAWKAEGRHVEAGLAAKLDARGLAREMDHDAHLAMLRRIDAALTVPAIALKGPQLAARYYVRPSARGTTDIDLLVAEQDVDSALASLKAVGYELADSLEKVAWAFRNHHHIHLVRPGAPDLELHFHAYRGFGITLRNELLAERSLPADGFSAIRVPAAEDELVYLAVHAAAHRFGRLGWLYDLRLVVERMPSGAIAAAGARAREWGVARALALSAELLADVLGVDPQLVRPLGVLSRRRGELIRAIVAEPPTRLMRVATRLAYTAMLADTPAAALRYGRSYASDHARRLMGLD